MPGPDQFPSIVVLSASAGAGKTHALTHRYVKLLLSGAVPHNDPRNVLAITFTNNAAREMRQRVLLLLKELTLGQSRFLGEIADDLRLSEVTLRARARGLLETLIGRYDDFQVRTIDSFMATLFRTIALDQGFRPGYEIVLDSNPLVEAAFDRFLEDLKRNTEKRMLVAALVEIASEAHLTDRTFLWDPYGSLLRDVRRLVKRLAAIPVSVDRSTLDEDVKPYVERLKEEATALLSLIGASGARPDRHFLNDLQAAAAGDWRVLLQRTRKQRALLKSAGSSGHNAHDQRGPQIEEGRERLYQLLGQLALVAARTSYRASTITVLTLKRLLAEVELNANQLSVDDVARHLVTSLGDGQMPGMYERLGGPIHHFLIDEFQDTSPLQWAALQPLISEALSGSGSLFVVGDTKQSIYGFRGADWTIMSGLKEGAITFPSVGVTTDSLPANRRSGGVIVDYVRRVFSEKLTPGLAAAASLSGLAGHEQQVLPEREGKGWVELHTRQRGEEQRCVVELVRSAAERGYGYADIAILTPGNATVVKVGGWLNEEGIPFLSYSSMDVRTRKTTAELLALLRFLDAPVDDLAFVTFLTGEIWSGVMHSLGADAWQEEVRALCLAASADAQVYKVFQQRFPVVWEEHFAPLLARTGYLPLYDLVSEIFKTLRVFSVTPGETAAFAKFLEVIRDFEGRGGLKDFLRFADEDEEESEIWAIDPPQNSEAVSVMTIHKAKGLQYPVVIALFYDRPWNVQSPVLSLRPDTGSVQILRVNEDLSRFHPELERVYAERQRRVWADELHRLYVSLTRAEHELHVVSIPSARSGRFPSSIFPDPGRDALHRPPAPVKSRPTSLGVEPLYHHRMRETEAATPDSSSSPQARRGEAVHAVLQGIEYLEESPDEVVARIAAPDLNPEVTAAVARFLNLPRIRALFERMPGRRIWREQDLVDATGALFRVDRIVEDRTTVLIMDFKTGQSRNDEEYSRQVGKYMEMAREVFSGKTVSGLVAYVDRKETLEVV